MTHSGQFGHGGYLHGGSPDQSPSWNMALQEETSTRKILGQPGQGLGVIIGALMVFVLLVSLPYLLDKVQEQMIIQREKRLIVHDEPLKNEQVKSVAANKQASPNPFMSNALGEIGNTLISAFGLESMFGKSKIKEERSKYSARQEQGQGMQMPAPRFWQEQPSQSLQDNQSLQETSNNMTQGEQNVTSANPASSSSSPEAYYPPLPGFRTNAQGYQVYLPNSVQQGSYVIQPPVTQVPSVMQIPVNQQAYNPGYYAPPPTNLGNVVITSPSGVRGNGQYAAAIVDTLRQESAAMSLGAHHHRGYVIR